MFCDGGGGGEEGCYRKEGGMGTPEERKGVRAQREWECEGESVVVLFFPEAVPQEAKTLMVTAMQ